MKLWTFAWTLALGLCLLSACGGGETVTEGAPPGGTAAVKAADIPEPPPSLAEDEEPTVMLCRIVDGAEEGVLLLAELEEDADSGNGVYWLDMKHGGPEDGTKLLTGVAVESRQRGPVPVYLDGEAAEVSALEDGMAVEIAFNGNVLESFPAQLGEVYAVRTWSRGQGENGMGTLYDLCGLYLQVLDDLWQKDPALNENISLAGLDLSQAPGGLTENEKSALAWRFGETHGVEVVAGTFQELEEQGYFTSGAAGIPAPGADSGNVWMAWEDGCFFSITPNEEHEDEVYSLPALFFNAEKWRTFLAAYGFYDCSALWAEGGSWDGYSIGAEMIS